MPRILTNSELARWEVWIHGSPWATDRALILAGTVKVGRARYQVAWHGGSKATTSGLLLSPERYPRRGGLMTIWAGPIGHQGIDWSRAQAVMTIQLPPLGNWPINGQSVVVARAQYVGPVMSTRPTQARAYSGRQIGARKAIEDVYRGRGRGPSGVSGLYI